MRNWIFAGLLLALPALGWARGPVTHTVTRTAYFPGGTGSVVVVDSKQGSGVYTGARKTYVKVGKRTLTKSEMDALKSRYKFSDRKFGVHKSWTVTTVRKNHPF